MRISVRGLSMPASPIRRLIPYANKAKEKGISVYHLNIGDPDVPTPKVILKAIKGFKQKVLPYGPSEGLKELREVISDYFGDYGIDVEPDNVFITTGGSEAIFFVLSAICDPGDEVIIPEPFYTNYNGFANMAGVKIKPLTLSVENGFHLPPKEEIKHLITDKTRAILICSPNNPTGTVYSREEIQSIIDLALEYDLWVLSDEVYREFVFDGKKHTSVLEFKEAAERTVVMDSISKRFSCCGARIGFIVTRNRELWSTLLKFGQARLCPPTIEQMGAIAGFKHWKEFMPGIIDEYRLRRDVVFEEIENIDGAFTLKPEGAFYTVVKLPVDDAEEFIKWMLTEFNINGKTTMLAPASGFYATEGTGLDEARIAYVLNQDKLRDAMNILREGLKVYAGNKG
ncbi:MAG TPA: pyridoxal phosphate-dependent aminotransferase [candidate division WOR-3 bacterium]|uniref:Pyridoxal phosphate-dependent aminotransferase n=1 Tax=candidate division WOR-3 bacterium TaxID=2052148 RepID=A0A7C0VBY8_UNCW3|nr:pyridoxal phosphate-dependent aminotransferase [candidate division WOR-3 bacterium]